MASPSSSSTASFSPYPHPQFAGKGLPSQTAPPPQAYYPPPGAYGAHHHYAHPGPPPDLTERYKLKAKYHKLQKNYFKGIEIRNDLTIELAEKEAKVQQLQDEVDLLLDQIHDSDYAHLRPAEDDLFSSDEGSQADGDEEGGGDEDAEMVKTEEGEEGAASARGKAKGKGRAKRKTLDELEDERRRELEDLWGVDGSKPQATLPPPAAADASINLDPAAAPPPALPPLPSAVDPSQLLNNPPAPAPAPPVGAPAAAATAGGAGGMKLKLKFGGGGGA
ncbi:hypothetical protein JCM6882_000696 [Rhodosporidiobolus microsporus]